MHDMASWARTAWSAYAWTERWAARAWEQVRYAWALTLATYRVGVLQRFLCDQEFWVYKVSAVNEEDGTDANVTKMFDPEAWEASVRLCTRWTASRIRADVRYLAHGKKFRMVLRPGDACTFPPIPERHRGGPKGVMAAELVGPGDLAVNITPRVLKYQGPAKDFHRGMGLRVGVTDLFPFDDADELKHNFSALRVVDARARVLDLPIDCPDLAAELVSDQKSD